MSNKTENAVSASKTTRTLTLLTQRSFPSEAHAMAGRRPAVARSERSERSVRKALLQKIELF